MATLPTKSTDVEAIVNRANVALARSQRLIASWLPPRTLEEIANTKTEEELEKEDQDLFAPVPELLGLGAVIPKEDAERSIKRRELSSTERLRQQILGKRAVDKKARAAPGANNVSPSQGSLTKPQGSSKPQLHDSEDEEEGRTSSIKSKRLRTVPVREKDGGILGRQKANTTEKGHMLAREGSPGDPDHDGHEDADSDRHAVTKVVITPEQKPLKPTNNYSHDIVSGGSRKKKKRKKHKHKSNGDEQG